MLRHHHVLRDCGHASTSESTHEAAVHPANLRRLRALHARTRPLRCQPPLQSTLAPPEDPRQQQHGGTQPPSSIDYMDDGEEDGEDGFVDLGEEEEEPVFFGNKPTGSEAEGAAPGEQQSTDEEAPSENVLGGEPRVEAMLAAGLAEGETITVDRLSAIFKFPLDPFQRSSIEALLQGRSVVVCAPTGAGKTAIAEAAAMAALMRGQRVIYTTPLKALSNQKLFETRRLFGTTRCGLQTGDTSLNTEADIVVMTTEILRNIMYRTAENSDEGGEGATGTNQTAREARLGDVGLVVLDEVHYLGDPSRGSVWEEVIINCPRHIQLLCMSATVKNPDDLGAWISKEHQECVTIKTRFRPVPLNWHFAYRNNDSRNVMVHPLLDRAGTGLNPILSAQQVMLDEAKSIVRQNMSKERYENQRSSGGRASSSDSRSGGGYSKGGGRSNNSAAADSLEATLLQMQNPDGSYLQKRMITRRIPDIPDLVARLGVLQWLPAIWFILSRRDCDLNAIKAGSALVLNSPEEQALIRKEVEALREDQPDSIRDKMLPALYNGVASHHAGNLPGWKGLVEKLFQCGAIKLIFATGTLAAGINMPARTTLVSALGRKVDDGTKQPLPHNELLQMAGRAGRRGFDTVGNCIVVQNKWEGADEAWAILRAGPEPLKSQFSVSYSLALNLLSVYSLEQAREFVARSFGHFMQTEGSERNLAEIVQLEARAADLMAAAAQSASSTVLKLNAQVKGLKEEIRRLKFARQDVSMASALELLAAEGLPRQVLLDLRLRDSKKALLVPALLMEVVAQPQADYDQAAAGPTRPEASKAAAVVPHYACLSTDNRVLRASLLHVVGVLEGAAGVVSAEEAKSVMAVFNKAPEKAWLGYGAGMGITCQAVPGNAATARLALRLQAKQAYCLADTGVELTQQVADQRALLKAATKELERQRAESVANGTIVEGDAEGEYKAVPGGEDKVLRAQRLLRRADELRKETQVVLENTWRSFTTVVDILVAMNALEAGTLRLLPLGLAVRSLQGQNELWLALALSHPAVAELNGPQMAALFGAILSTELVKRGELWAAYTASDEVVRVVDQLEEVRMLLFNLQSEGGLARWNDFLVVDLRLAGIVEAWAAGASWQQIMADSTMDDGDVARLLFKTTDLLKQVASNKQMLPYLRDTANEALQGMDRKPVAEVFK